MSSLLDDHIAGLSEGSEQEDRCSRKPCWEHLSCIKVLCPAFGKTDADCWLTPRTLCGNYLGTDFVQKLSGCMACRYFRKMSASDPKGWDHFLALQIQRSNTKALEHLYQKEESFIEILNRIPDGLFTTDQEWRITYFNPAAEKITGFTAFDAVGMYCKDVFKNAICETDCALKRAVEEGCNIHNRRYVITNVDGKRIPIICSTSAFRDANGRVTGGLEIFKDITDIVKLEKELATRERKYRRIFEGSHDMIYTTNFQGDLLDVNQAGVDMMGYRSRDEFLKIGTAVELYANPKDREKFVGKINREGFVKDYEVTFKKQDGTPFDVLISSRRYENPNSMDIEFEGIIKDITQRKRAEENLRRRINELSILNSVAVALNHTMDLDHILQVTLKNVVKALNLARGGLFLFEREKKRARMCVRLGLDPEDATEPGVIFKDDLLMQHLIYEEKSLPPEPTFPSFKAAYKTAGGNIVPWLTCFIITFRGKVMGFFGLDIPDGRVLSQHEIHLLGSLGNFLGGAIENTRLMETIRLNRQELRNLTQKLFTSQEEERRRIARELHDESGQSLTAIKLCLDRLEDRITEKEPTLKEEIAEIRKMLKRTANEIRQLSYRLHPTLLSDLGLEPALNLYFKEVMNHSDLDIEFHMVGFDERLDPDTETLLYRFCQEALTNTLKHSGAESFRVSLIKSYPKIIFLAEDDGVGFDGRIGGMERPSLGLIGMRERASLLGGTFSFKSTPGSGTRIRIEVPNVSMANAPVDGPRP